jgi:hypothetical protein
LIVSLPIVDNEHASLAVLEKEREMAHYHARYTAHHHGQEFAAIRSRDIATQVQAFHLLPDNTSGLSAPNLVGCDIHEEAQCEL